MPTLLLPLLGSRAATAASEGNFWLPPGASTSSAEIDYVFKYIYVVDVVLFVVLMGTMLLFFLKYKQRNEGERTADIKGSHSLELAWATLPSFLLFFMFYLGFHSWIDMAVPPADSMQVRVEGQKWSWNYTYPDLGISSDVLRVPAGTPVQLTMSSKDVLHSFFVPDFRIKKDVLPNRYTVLWFEAPEPGSHQVYCTEFCGDGHSAMLSTVEVMPQAEYDAWVESQQAFDPSSLTSVERGELLYKQKGCIGCHSVDGAASVGPSLKGKYGTDETLADGTTVKVDDNYLRESINVPAAKIVAGFAPSMPPFQGQLTDDELNALIDYLKSLAG